MQGLLRVDMDKPNTHEAPGSHQNRQCWTRTFHQPLTNGHPHSSHSKDWLDQQYSQGNTKHTPDL